MGFILVEVTAEDIRLGRRNDCLSCPVALALQRLFGTDLISVSKRLAILPDGGFLPLPEKVEYFIHSFDWGFPVSLFAFTLEVPDAIAATTTPARAQQDTPAYDQGQ